MPNQLVSIVSLFCLRPSISVEVLATDSSRAQNAFFNTLKSPTPKIRLLVQKINGNHWFTT